MTIDARKLASRQSRMRLLMWTPLAVACGSTLDAPASMEGSLPPMIDSPAPRTFAPADGSPVPDEASEGGEGSSQLLFPEADVGSLQPTAAAPRAVGESLMPADFTAADRGGWKLGAPLDAAATDGSDRAADSRPDGCGSILTGVLRDISEGHPDFGGDVTGLQRGLVQADLGADGKPALSPIFDEGFIESADSFRQWYETVPDVNLAYSLALYFEPSDGKFSFESHDFFPLDGEGFGNQDQDHNFSFTFELHTRFRYRGGERFQFSGDDDLWVFINGRLAIDLGGVHSASSDDLLLDEAASHLGIEVGQEYALDFFQAERHATQSNFQVDTTLEFTNCGFAAPR